MEKNPSGPASRQKDILPNSCCADLFTEFTHAVFSTLGLNVRRGVRVRVCGRCACACASMCVHPCPLVLMAAVDQARGALEGATPG